MDFISKIDSIESKEDFVSFVELLAQDFNINSKDWENKTIPQFLEAIASWTEDMEGYYINNRLPIPININWKVIAEILMAAKMYE